MNSISDTVGKVTLNIQEGFKEILAEVNESSSQYNTYKSHVNGHTGGFGTWLTGKGKGLGPLIHSEHLNLEGTWYYDSQKSSLHIIPLLRGPTPSS